MPARRRRAARRLLILAAVAAAALFGVHRLRERTLPARATAAALRSYVHAGYRFRCERIHPDITIALSHVTYHCDPTHPGADRTGYWVSTDLHRITGVQPEG